MLDDALCIEVMDDFTLRYTLEVTFICDNSSETVTDTYRSIKDAMRGPLDRIGRHKTSCRLYVSDSLTSKGEEGPMTEIVRWKRLTSFLKARDGQRARIDHVVSVAGRETEYSSREGFLRVTGKTVTFVDGDFEIPISSPRQVEVVPVEVVKKNLSPFGRDTYSG